MPFYTQSMGNFTDAKAAFWTGLFSTVFGLIMFLSGLVWSIVADR
jgi:hypothetical protein